MVLALAIHTVSTQVSAKVPHPFAEPGLLSSQRTSYKLYSRFQNLYLGMRITQVSSLQQLS